ncbi:sensor histidine kinase [Thalassotalea profundi]|uniref:sensor histidine kinase n=1 Tax=Thalassotalea profundi TaxID=2036687 RepID=UPI0016774DB2|nr:HAMP domain-containing sensor histidine kinase [Thalassotalea profundi]
MQSLALLIIFASLLYFAYQQVQKNYLNRAANIIITVMSTVILSFSWLNQGIRDEVLLVFPALITFAVIMGSRKGLYIMFTVIIINLLLMGYLNDAEIVSHSVNGVGISSAILIIIIFGVVFYSIRILGADLIEANNQLMQQQQVLEIEVKNRTSALEQTIQQFVKAKSDLVEADKMASLGRLVAGVAHEINTPVGVAVTAASLIKDRNEQILKSFELGTLARNQLSDYLNATNQSMEILNTNLYRASNLIADFKEVAVLKEDERRTVFDLQTEIINALTCIQQDSEKEHFKIHIDCPDNINVYQDPEVLTRILINLYTNSIKHGFESKQEGDITIKVTLTRDIIHLSYQDTGIGLSESAIKKVFEPFYTTKRGQGGTGLGMHIVFNLVTQSLGGEIQYDNTCQTGAKFDIIFSNNLANTP